MSDNIIGTVVSVRITYIKMGGPDFRSCWARRNEWIVRRQVKCGKYELHWLHGKGIIHVPKHSLDKICPPEKKYYRLIHPPSPEYTVVESQIVRAMHGLDLELEMRQLI